MFSGLKKRFNRFVSDPIKLFRLFILANLIPSVLLFFTEPYSLTGKILLISFPAGVYLVIYSLLKSPGLMQLLLFPQLFFNAFQIVLFYLFGRSVIAADMFLNLATTNVTEAGELLNNLWPAVVLVCVIYIPTLVIGASACRKKAFLSASFRKKAAAWGLAIAVMSYGLTFLTHSTGGERFCLKNDIFPVNIYNNLAFAVQKWHKSMNYPETSRDFTFNANRDTTAGKREIYVIVVGEAGRAGNWSLLGYERETNPLLSGTEGMVMYKDALTQANATHKSVPMMLSAACAEKFDVIYRQKSIIEAFKECGFTTVFLSNQTPNRSFTDYFAMEADYHSNIRPASNGSWTTENNYDTHMLPLLKHYIDSIPGNLFAVVHTYGSHFNYQERYPREFAFYTPDSNCEVEVSNRQQLVNAYDNSIRYTDYFLHNLISMLDSTGCCSGLYYSPDHGEDLLDDGRNRFLHASPVPTYYQLHVPLFLWFSEEFRHTFPDKYKAALDNAPQPVSTNASCFHTMLDMAAIRTEALDSCRSLVNPAFRPSPRYYLNDHDQAVGWLHSGLEEEDFRVIREKGLDCREFR